MDCWVQLDTYKAEFDAAFDDFKRYCPNGKLASRIDTGDIPRPLLSSDAQAGSRRARQVLLNNLVKLQISLTEPGDFVQELAKQVALVMSPLRLALILLRRP